MDDFEKYEHNPLYYEVGVEGAAWRMLEAKTFKELDQQNALAHRLIDALFEAKAKDLMKELSKDE